MSSEESIEWYMFLIVGILIFLMGWGFVAIFHFCWGWGVAASFMVMQTLAFLMRGGKV